MPTRHTMQEILACLKDKTTGVLATSDENSKNTRLRIMYYGVDDKFAVYLMSVKDAPKIANIVNSPQASFLVYGVEEPYENTWEIEINGYAELISGDAAVGALEKLKGRNPFADVALESGITNRFELIRLSPKNLRFSNYGEALTGIAPTVLNF